MRHLNLFAGAGLIVAAVLVTGRARADVPAFTMTGFTDTQSNNNPSHYSVGYTFELQQPETVTALGALDVGGNSIGSNQIPVNIYWSSPTPEPVGSTYPAPVGHVSTGRVVGFSYGSTTISSSDPIFSLTGDAYTSGDGFRYHTLDTPIQLDAGFYMITESDFGTGFEGGASNFTAAPSIIGPTMSDSSNGTNYIATFDPNTPDDTAGYNTSPAPAAFGPGIFGPNFLVATPEPGLMGLLLACGGFVLRRRR